MPSAFYADRALQCEIPEHLKGKKFRATWVSYHERSLWCCDFSEYENNRPGLLAEIEMSDTVIRQQPADSVLVAVVLYQVRMTPEIREFFRANSERDPNPIRKMAILSVSGPRRLWYQAQSVKWHKNTRFFDDYEKAKAWLVRDTI